ncbi:23S rRNA (guanosine(2251)-2'-O)-methyltransferase RlmB [Alkalibacter rhizosphaerae]|uniref:23S rRNA (Guanosine(2251)-2'-O)-methyltransferase RlmB n=1 Tax=Alkalibacter rhizosphaerae TaxID=2815577 RepID=A0A975AH05_9FIRM|nr:23S rRNA (guanosine(2251)-2'-O)-methyltransferase RlmB [Alkalibacter rhizosphaerae]QSX07508.1 23S rRNA (guanosine(2251)-2'-O)-methyltransferase RlmB [Alkalibacter rhizosphaerae]
MKAKRNDKNAKEQGKDLRRGKDKSTDLPEKTDKPERPPRDVRQIEGKNPVLEALRSDVTIEKIMVAKGRRETGNTEIFDLAKERNIKIQMVDRKKLDYSTKTGNHQGIIAVATNFSYYEPEQMIQKAKDLGEDPFIVVLDQLTDPHNFGAIIRSADACGVHGIIITKNRSVDLTPIAVKASAGAAEHMMIGKVTNLAQTLQDLKEKGFWIGGADMSGEAYYNTNLKGPLAIVIGSEGKGIGRLVKENCDFTISIPMYGNMESLNASVAAGVLFCEAARQRKGER